MKRIILTANETATFEDMSLTLAQRTYLIDQFIDYRNQMPASIVFLGKKMMDCLAEDTFSMENFAAQGLPFTIIYAGSWSGAGQMVDIHTLDISEFIKYTADGTPTEPHRWAGWPDGGFTNAFTEGFLK